MARTRVPSLGVVLAVLLAACSGGSETERQPAVCGDGALAGTEACDDGDAVNGDGCDTNCTVSACGNGIAAGAEACDTAGASATCDADCTAPVCGDNLVNALAGEDCDDGGESFSCDVDCTIPACGDGTPNAATGEQCDTSGESAACDANCTAVSCGDGTVNVTAGEACDTSGESATCDRDCTAASCGDGTKNVTAGEACDTAGESATCDANCTAVSCGDGTVNATAGEQCDSAGETAACDGDCTVALCGDGTKNAAAGEECDDANATAGDGCSPGCKAEVVALDPPRSYVYVGQSGVPTIPTPATVRLAAPVAADTFVTVSSSGPFVTVVGGGVTIPAGQSSAQVLVSGVAEGTVWLAATLGGGVGFGAFVQAVSPTAQPAVSSVSSPGAWLTPGGTHPFTVTLDIPATAGGAVVSLDVAPAAAGAVPATVAIPEGQVAATFDYVDAGVADAVTITATLGASSDAAGLRTPGLVINEVDYDNGGADTAEFVEIYNASAAPVDLGGIALYFVDGATQTSYLRVPLSGTLPPGGYAVVATGTVAVDPSALRFDLPAAQDNVENGSPDAIALVDEVALRVLDAISYEGVTGPSTLGALPGTYVVTEGAGAIFDPGYGGEDFVRARGGIDTNDNRADFKLALPATPGWVNTVPGG